MAMSYLPPLASIQLSRITEGVLSALIYIYRFQAVLQVFFNSFFALTYIQLLEVFGSIFEFPLTYQVVTKNRFSGETFLPLTFLLVGKNMIWSKNF